MPRPHIRLLYSGTVDPKAPLDPRYHPLGQPGKPYKLYPFYKACLKVPYGLRVPVVTVIYLTICWNARHWLYPYGASMSYIRRYIIINPLRYTVSI